MQKHAVIPIILISMLFLMFSCGRKSEDAIVKPDGTSAFTVIRSDDASVCPPEFAVSLKNAIIGITGVDIGIKTDFVSDRIPDSAEGEYEIIVGKTSREITAEFAPLAPRLNDWLIARTASSSPISCGASSGAVTAGRSSSTVRTNSATRPRIFSSITRVTATYTSRTARHISTRTTDT